MTRLRQAVPKGNHKIFETDKNDQGNPLDDSMVTKL